MQQFYFLFNLFVVFNQEGNAYLGELDERVKYFTESGKAYRIKDGYLVDLSDDSNRYSLSISYLDRNGNLIIDTNKLYKQTIEYLGISQLADSFFHLFILLLLCSVGMWIVIPFAQGAAEIEFLLNEGKEVSSQYTLKAILQKMKPDEVWIWRKHYIFISIMYLAAWFAVMLIDSGILC